MIKKVTALTRVTALTLYSSSSVGFPIRYLAKSPPSRSLAVYATRAALHDLRASAMPNKQFTKLRADAMSEAEAHEGLDREITLAAVHRSLDEEEGDGFDMHTLSRSRNKPQRSVRAVPVTDDDHDPFDSAASIVPVAVDDDDEEAVLHQPAPAPSSGSLWKHACLTCGLFAGGVALLALQSSDFLKDDDQLHPLSSASIAASSLHLPAPSRPPPHLPGAPPPSPRPISPPSVPVGAPQTPPPPPSPMPLPPSPELPLLASPSPVNPPPQPSLPPFLPLPPLPPHVPPSSPPPPVPLTGPLNADMCHGMLHNPKHLFRRMWAAEAGAKCRKGRHVGLKSETKPGWTNQVTPTLRRWHREPTAIQTGTKAMLDTWPSEQYPAVRWGRRWGSALLGLTNPSTTRVSVGTVDVVTTQTAVSLTASTF